MIYLVTGCAGFIGYHTARSLLESGHTVVGLDSVNDYYSTALKEARLGQLSQAKGSENWLFVRGCLEDDALLERIFTEHRFDSVIHLAAQAGVRYSITNPKAYIKSNIDGYLSVLEACRKHAVRHLAYASSSSVYGLNDTYPFSESQRADHPASLYAATKRSNELMAHSYGHLFALPTTGMRFFTVYGPWGRPDMAYFSFADSISAGKPIHVYNNGNMLRDFTYIDDVVSAIITIANSPPLSRSPEVPARVYNIGNSRPEKIEDLIGYIETSLGKKAVKEYLPMQAGDVVETYADISLMKRDFDWEPRTTLETGITRFINWYKENKKWR